MKRRERGFSVVELMVAMTISLLLLAGVLSVMYTSRVTYDDNTRIARLQEYARSSLELMLRDMRGSGYLGCARPIEDMGFRNLLVNAAELRYDFERPVQGFEGTDGTFAPTLPAALATASPTNDVLVIRGLSDDPPLELNAIYPGGNVDLPIGKPAGVTIPAGTPVLVSDCEWANVVAISADVGVGATAFLERNIGAIAPAAGEVQMPENRPDGLPEHADRIAGHGPETVVYFIADSASGRGPALWRMAGNRGPEELVEGVERIEAQFGQDTNNDLLVDAYRDADAVTNWNQVLSVSLAVLMRAPEAGGELAPANQTFEMLGTTVGPFADRRPRILFTTSAAVRNRAL